MKKYTALLLLMLLILSAFAGCNNEANETDGTELKVAASIYPIYDWVKNIANGAADVELLIDNGVDMHSFQPSVDDLVKINNYDIFIYVGGESDEWINDLAGSSSSKTVFINLFDLLGTDLKEEEIIEGMQADEADGAYDEHIWLSLRYAAKCCEFICDKLSEYDSENSEIYNANANEYVQKLESLDNEYTENIQNAKNDTLLFADRFPFRYLTDDYGLKYYAAFSGCSAESEASFETVVFLVNKIEELGLGYIIRIDNSDGALAETIKRNTDSKSQEILILDSMQSVTQSDISNGSDYLSVMKSNLEVLIKVLN